MQEPQTLIDAALQGDAASWKKLVERYGPLVWSVGRDCGLNHQDREDLAQAVFTILLRQLPPHVADAYATQHDDALRRCLQDLLQIGLLPGSRHARCMALPVVMGGRWPRRPGGGGGDAGHGESDTLSMLFVEYHVQ